jgi:uncharacterized membrane protein
VDVRGGIKPHSGASAPENFAAGSRIASIDVLRGLAMALMALDHTRDFFASGSFNPRDVTDPALFLTRWVTHFCAPAFVLLSGISAYLYGRGRGKAELGRFLFTRGLWLILVEFTLINFAWGFDPSFYQGLGAGVIWVIGASMLVLAALIWLPRWAIAVVAFGMILGHNLLDGIRAEDLGAAAPLWHVLHDPGRIQLTDTVRIYVLYTLVPWAGVMAAGYLLGPTMLLDPATRRRRLYQLGAGITAGFVLLRATNLYGDAAPWSVQATPLATILSFINTEKYPPSLLFLMMTLGPSLMLLAAFEHARGRIADGLVTFGRVPFFYYVVHLYLIHALAIVAAFAVSGTFVAREPEIELGLPGVYLAWLVVLALLYPLCRWFADIKARRKEWWWSYL